MKKLSLVALVAAFLAQLCPTLWAAVNYTNFETTSAFVTVKVTPKWIRYSWTPVSGYPGGGVWDTTIFERDFQTEAYTVFPLESVVLGDDIIVPGHEPLGAPTTPTPGMTFEQPGGYEYTLESINQRPAPPSPTLDPNVWPELALVVRRSGEAGGIVTSSDPFIEQTESFAITLGQSLDIKVMATSAGYLQWAGWWVDGVGINFGDPGTADFVTCTPSTTQEQSLVVTGTFTPSAAGTYTIYPSGLAGQGWDGLPVVVTVVTP